MVLHNAWLVEWEDNKEPWMQRADYKLQADFQLHEGLAPVVSTWFKGHPSKKSV